MSLLPGAAQPLLHAFAGAFTPPAFKRFITLMLGAVLIRPRTITNLLRSSRRTRPRVSSPRGLPPPRTPRDGSSASARNEVASPLGGKGRETGVVDVATYQHEWADLADREDPPAATPGKVTSGRTVSAWVTGRAHYCTPARKGPPSAVSGSSRSARSAPHPPGPGTRPPIRLGSDRYVLYLIEVQCTSVKYNLY